MSTFDPVHLTPWTFNETLTLVDPPVSAEAFREYDTINHVFRVLGVSGQDWFFVHATRTDMKGSGQDFYFIQWQGHTWSEQRHCWVDSIEGALGDLEGELREMVALVDPAAPSPAFKWYIQPVQYAPSLRGQPTEVRAWVNTLIEHFPEGCARLEARMLDANLAGAPARSTPPPRL
jgi:hypothetical protein